MKFTLPILLFAFSLFAQQQITLNEIWSGTYAQEHLSSIVPMQNPNYYTTFEYDAAIGATKVVKHHYNNESNSEVVVSSENLPIRYFENYQFSTNETKLILGAQMESRYRYTQSGLYFVYDIKTKSLQSVFDKPVFNPSFSPDANKVAFIFENNSFDAIMCIGVLMHLEHPELLREFVRVTKKGGHIILVNRIDRYRSLGFMDEADKMKNENLWKNLHHTTKNYDRR